MERESYYQELTPVITEADMSQDLQGELARWRPKNATVWFECKSKGLRTRRDNAEVPA